MKCTRCHKNEASIEYKSIINGRSREENLCADCARELGLSFGAGGAAPSWGSLAGMFGNLYNPNWGQMWLPGSLTPDQREVCPHCGMTWREFRSCGRLGCADCYGAFADQLKGLYARVQRGTKYEGRQPAGSQSAAATVADEIAELRAAQALAVKNEDYEQAARLRDRIRALSGEGGSK